MLLCMGGNDTKYIINFFNVRYSHIEIDLGTTTL